MLPTTTTTTKPRPVPSKGALRVLYQLAYISSGTAVGVGVLCAEERRRRTQVVQRIVENGRRLRGSEKYRGYGSAALAMREREVQEQGYEAAMGETRGAEAEGSRRMDVKEAMKGRDLPSVVGKEYEMIYPETRKERRSFADEGGRESRFDKFGPMSKRKSRGTEEESTTRKDAEAGEDSRRLHERGFRVRLRQDGMREQVLGRAKPYWSEHQTRERSRSRELEAWQERCRELLDVGQLSEAITTFHRSPANTEANEYAHELADELFQAALERKWFGKCATILRLEPKGATGFDQRCEALIQACNPEENKMLLELVFQHSRMFRRLSLANLKQGTREKLAIACLAEPSRAREFKRLYNSLDSEGRSGVDSQQSPTLLKVTWRRTRNIDTVLAQLQSTTEHMERIGAEVPMQQFNKAMTEIYISANRPHEALETISRMKRSDANSSDSIGLAAIAFAKRKAWDSVERIIRHAESVGSFKMAPRSHKHFGGLISVYAKHHSATQIWKFVTRLMEKLHFAPGQSTMNIVLQAFVSKDAIMLVPKWLRMLKVSGVQYEFNTCSAVDLLQAYHKKHRPSHVLMMWFCRNLAHWVPGFDSKEFVGLVERSIADDVAGTTEERNKVWQKHHTLQRLDRLGAAKNEVPSPGYKYNGHLHFSHPSATRGPMDEVPPDSKEEGQDKGVARKDLVKPEESGKKGLKSHVRQEEHAMSILLSLRKYEEVLQKYEDSFEAYGAIMTPQTLSLAVRASLRLHSSDEHAVQMVWHAEKAGMNVMEALSYLMIHQMQQLDSSDTTLAKRLRATTLRYYDLAREKRHDASSYLGVTASHLLINNGHPRAGLSLLSQLETLLEDGEQLFPNIVSVTVKMRGYSVLGSSRRVCDCVSYVVRRDFRISSAFLRELKLSRSKMAGITRRERAQLTMFLEICRSRREEQRLQAKMVGKKLVRTIASIMREEATVGLESRREVDQQLFGSTPLEGVHLHEADGQYGRGYDGPFTMTPEAGLNDALGFSPPALNRPDDAAADQDSSNSDQPEFDASARSEQTSRPQGALLTRRARLTRLARTKSQISRAIQWDNRLDSHARQASRLHDVRWMRQYRAFLRKPMVDDEGRESSFRWLLPSESQTWKRRERQRRGELGSTWMEGDQATWRPRSEQSWMRREAVGARDGQQALEQPNEMTFVPLSVA